MTQHLKKYDVVRNKVVVGDIAAGTLGSIVYVYDEQRELFEVEFVDDDGMTVGVLTVRGEDLMSEQS